MANGQTTSVLSRGLGSLSIELQPYSELISFFLFIFIAQNCHFVADPIFSLDTYLNYQQLNILFLQMLRCGMGCFG